jgi:hypothetical protein
MLAVEDISLAEIKQPNLFASSQGFLNHLNILVYYLASGFRF